MDNTPRDPHLPPPAVVDWLMEQDWSVMIPITSIQYQGAKPHGMTKSKHWEYQMACPVLGEDDAGRILLPVETLDAFRKDRDARLADFEQKRQAPESEEAVRKALQQYAFRPLDWPSPAIGDAFEHADEMARKANHEHRGDCKVEAVKVVWPLPFGHEWPWNRPGWSDDQGRCWLCIYPDDGWHVPTWKLARPSDYDLAAAIRGECVLTLPHDSLPLPVPQIKVSPEP